MTAVRFPHSETPGSKPGCRLPGEYRRLQRPSSAPGAKASTVCPKKLGTYTTNTVTALQKQEMLASTVQFSKNRRNQAGPTPYPRGRTRQPLLKTRPRAHMRRGARFLRTQQRAHSRLIPLPPFRTLPREGRTNQRPGTKPGVNSQCSTRKHERPRRHPLRQTPDAP
jgi:hypothetical protein